MPICLCFPPSPPWPVRDEENADKPVPAGLGMARYRPSKGEASDRNRTFWARSDPCWKEKKDEVGGGGGGGMVGADAAAASAWVGDDGKGVMLVDREVLRRCVCQDREREWDWARERGR
jgi:hypothetical protein